MAGECISLCFTLSFGLSSYLHGYWVVGVGGQNLPRRTEVGVGEHVLGRVVQDVRCWRWAGSDLRSRLLLEEMVKHALGKE